MLKESEQVVIYVRAPSSALISKMLQQGNTPSRLTPAASPLLASYHPSFERLILVWGLPKQKQQHVITPHRDPSQRKSTHREIKSALHLEDINLRPPLHSPPQVLIQWPPTGPKADSSPRTHIMAKRSTLSKCRAAAQTNPIAALLGEGVKSFPASGIQGCNPNKTVGTTPTCSARE